MGELRLLSNREGVPARSPTQSHAHLPTGACASMRAEAGGHKRTCACVCLRQFACACACACAHARARARARELLRACARRAWRDARGADRVRVLPPPRPLGARDPVVMFTADAGRMRVCVRQFACARVRGRARVRAWACARGRARVRVRVGVGACACACACSPVELCEDGGDGAGLARGLDVGDEQLGRDGCEAPVIVAADERATRERDRQLHRLRRARPVRDRRPEQGRQKKGGNERVGKKGGRKGRRQCAGETGGRKRAEAMGGGTGREINAGENEQGRWPRKMTWGKRSAGMIRARRR
eukprot:6176668-Pleurochrysis_carterae.AAC.2